LATAVAGLAAAVLVAVTLRQQRRSGCLESEGSKGGGDVLSPVQQQQQQLMARLELGKIVRTDLGSTHSTALLYPCELQCVHLVF